MQLRFFLASEKILNVIVKEIRKKYITTIYKVKLQTKT